MKKQYYSIKPKPETEAIIKKELPEIVKQSISECFLYIDFDKVKDLPDEIRNNPANQLFILETIKEKIRDRINEIEYESKLRFN